MELRGRPGTIDYAKIEALYKQGHSDSEISKIVGCSRTTVRRWRDKNNVPPFGGTRQTTTKSVTDRKRTKKPTKKWTAIMSKMMRCYDFCDGCRSLDRSCHRQMKQSY